MNQAMASIKQAWQARQPREQRALRVLGLALLTAALWQWVWVPALQWRDHQRADSDAARALYQHLREQAPALLAGRAAASQMESRPLPEVAAALALQQGVQLQAPQADAAGHWQLLASAAEAPLLLHWLQQLQQTGVQISQLHLQATKSGWELSAQATR